MATLKKETKIFIVQQLAMFKQPQEVVDLVEQTFKIKPSISQVCYYDPKYGKISKDLVAIYEDTRKRFLDTISEIPIANEAYRLEQLQMALIRTKNARVVNEAMILNILEQAAKERGGMFTNRREITGKGGKDLFNPVDIAKAVMSDLINEGWQPGDAIKFVSDRYKVNEADLVSETVN